MARSTGPILALGAITIVNQSVIHDEPVDLRVIVATGLTAGLFALGEKALEEPVVALAWLALAVSLLVRTDPRIPAPIETAADFWAGKA